MPYSTVHVQYHDGSRATGVRVVLGFSMGMTSSVSTDSHGTALIEHASTGRADVYVSGKKYTPFHAPGETAVTIRT